MIEELQDYLIRHGWAEDVAVDIHMAYYYKDMIGVRDYAKTLSTDQHDFEDETLNAVWAWREEVGELPRSSEVKLIKFGTHIGPVPVKAIVLAKEKYLEACESLKTDPYSDFDGWIDFVKEAKDELGIKTWKELGITCPYFLEENNEEINRLEIESKVEFEEWKEWKERKTNKNRS
jgi:hypothetical protein